MANGYPRAELCIAPPHLSSLLLYQFTAETLRIASYNCRNVKTSVVDNIRQPLIIICDNNDIIFHSRKSPPLANNVEEATGHVDITNMWYDHFKGLLNCIDNITHRKYVLDSIGNMPMQYEIKSAIEGLKGSKASGTDSVFAEHLKYARAKIHVLLSGF